MEDVCLRGAKVAIPAVAVASIHRASEAMRAVRMVENGADSHSEKANPIAKVKSRIRKSNRSRQQCVSLIRPAASSVHTAQVAICQN